jgi:hypothetical protein
MAYNPNNYPPHKFDAVKAILGAGAVVGWDKTNDVWMFPDGGELPSEADINAKLAELTTEYEAKKYQMDREYPSIGEQLDMLFHDMTAGKGSKTGEWYKAVAKVKSDNPKP